MAVDSYFLLEVDTVQVLGLALEQVQDEGRVLEARKERVDLLFQHLRSSKGPHLTSLLPNSAAGAVDNSSIQTEQAFVGICAGQ